MLPYIEHFHPPSVALPIQIVRYSPYFNKPEKYGISRIRSREYYQPWLPSTCDPDKLAYFFDGDFDSGYRSDPDLANRFRSAVQKWSEKWRPTGMLFNALIKQDRPVLQAKAGRGSAVLIEDTRSVARTRETRLSKKELAMLSKLDRPLPVSATGETIPLPELQSLIDLGFVIEHEGFYLSLVTDKTNLIYKSHAENITNGVVG
jgi:hypothetical protein